MGFITSIGVPVSPPLGGETLLKPFGNDSDISSSKLSFDINEAFFNAYNDGELTSEKMDTFFSSTSFDQNYDEYLFFICAARKEDKELLARLSKDNEDKSEGLSAAFMIAASKKSWELMEFLILQGAELRSIMDHSVYCDPEIKVFVDGKLTIIEEKVAPNAVSTATLVEPSTLV